MHSCSPALEDVQILLSQQHEWQIPAGADHQGHLNVITGSQTVIECLLGLSSWQPALPLPLQAGIPCLQSMDQSRHATCMRHVATAGSLPEVLCLQRADENLHAGVLEAAVKRGYHRWQQGTGQLEWEAACSPGPGSSLSIMASRHARHKKQTQTVMHTGC